jgi:hypothetical protein
MWVAWYNRFLEDYLKISRNSIRQMHELLFRFLRAVSTIPGYPGSPSRSRRRR